MRVLVDIPEDDVERLDELAQRNGRSRAAEMREAVRLHLRRRQDNDWIARGAGYWKDRADLGDAMDYPRAIRRDRAG